jgi:hypothetical protein
VRSLCIFRGERWLSGAARSTEFGPVDIVVEKVKGFGGMVGNIQRHYASPVARCSAGRTEWGCVKIVEVVWLAVQLGL